MSLSIVDVRYVHAFDCGHRTWTGTEASAGIAWCFTCSRYVGVIITRQDREAKS